MHLQNALAKTFQPLPPAAIAEDVSICKLTDAAKAEVLDFLNQRPLHNVMLIGLVIDNGLVSRLNRGTFYGCRNRYGKLEGVAVIGHVTLIESSTDRALAQFAELAAKCTSTHMIMGESQQVREFWSWYASDGQDVRRVCGEHLLELRLPIEVRQNVSGLRLATTDDLDLIMPVHAQMAFEESGVNPLETDPEGFRARCIRRIEKNRTWVWVESGELMFKADIISDTPNTIYLEGVWMNPAHRSQGLGRRCLSQLVRELLSNKPGASVCLFVNELNDTALSFYHRAGFKDRGIYDTAFLKQA